jgi:hypothetical protein
VEYERISLEGIPVARHLDERQIGRREESMSKAVDFVVERSNLHRCQFVPAADPDTVDLPPGHVLLRVDAFAFTANNVTYAVIGEVMSYWNFFPAEPGWGRVPVWGFADVLRTSHESVARGERVFGYLPMSTHLVIQPDRVTPAGFVDASPHRRALPPVYNQYVRVANEPGYRADQEDAQMLFRPLFMTAFLLDDFLADAGFFGARTVILSSASSKTAFGLAFLLRQRSSCRVVGLTSAGNRAFVESLGCYDQVVTYDQVPSLPNEPAVFVDMAGNARVLGAIHHHFRDNLKHSAVVGLTHWEQRTPEGDLPGVPPTFFFAPTQIQKRTKDWGPDGLQERYGVAWRRFLDFATGRIRVVHGRGQAAVERVYVETLEGRVKPDEGHVLSLWD